MQLFSIVHYSYNSIFLICGWGEGGISRLLEIRYYVKPISFSLEKFGRRENAVNSLEYYNNCTTQKTLTINANRTKMDRIIAELA